MRVKCEAKHFSVQIDALEITGSSEQPLLMDLSFEATVACGGVVDRGGGGKREEEDSG